MRRVPEREVWCTAGRNISDEPEALPPTIGGECYEHDRHSAKRSAVSGGYRRELLASALALGCAREVEEERTLERGAESRRRSGDPRRRQDAGRGRPGGRDRRRVSARALAHGLPREVRQRHGRRRGDQDPLPLGGGRYRLCAARHPRHRQTCATGGRDLRQRFCVPQSVTTKAMPKQTIPSPSNMHFRGGRAAIDSEAYPDMEQFYDDLARVYREEIAGFAQAGCRYLQLDEVNLAYLCDPKIAAEVRSTIGEDPATLPRTYAKLINAAIASRPKEMTVCIHLCRGNAYSTWMAEGGYDPIAEVLFNEIDVDGFFLEYDTPRAGDFRPLRFLPKGKIVVLGLVTTKKGALETKDERKRRIDEAAKCAPLEQLALSPQCGFASGAAGNKLSVDEEIAKLRLIVDVAHEVWG